MSRFHLHVTNATHALDLCSTCGRQCRRALSLPAPPRAPRAHWLHTLPVHLAVTKNFQNHSQTYSTHLTFITNKMARSGIAVGVNKGRKVEAKQVAPKISYRKGALSKRTAFVRDIVKEVSGLAPYERRLIELIRNAGEKRAKKLAKKRLGTHKRALRKVEEMNKVITESKRH